MNELRGDRTVNKQSVHMHQQLLDIQNNNKVISKKKNKYS